MGIPPTTASSATAAVAKKQRPSSPLPKMPSHLSSNLLITVNSSVFVGIPPTPASSATAAVAPFFGNGLPPKNDNTGRVS